MFSLRCTKYTLMLCILICKNTNWLQNYLPLIKSNKWLRSNACFLTNTYWIFYELYKEKLSLILTKLYGTNIIIIFNRWKRVRHKDGGASNSLTEYKCECMIYLQSLCFILLCFSANSDFRLYHICKISNWEYFLAA